MKKKAITAILVALLAAVLFVVLIRTNSHNLSNRIPAVPVFIPDGFSDEYEDAKKGFLNEWQEIWMYDLKISEIDEIDKDLESGRWKPLSDEQIRYVDEVYFGEMKIIHNETDELFCSLFDCRAEEFTEFDTSDTLLYSKRQILFVYNKSLGDYYCVYIGM